jgi:hypothetical protein
MPVVDMNAGNGVAFLIGATVVSDLIAKACSSPQTAELNADKRAPTLMKWVNIGMIEAGAFIVIAAFIDPKHRTAIVAGGVLEGAVTWYEYQHAKKAGLASPEPSTEDYTQNQYVTGGTANGVH